MRLLFFFPKIQGIVITGYTSTGHCTFITIKMEGKPALFFRYENFKSKIFFGNTVFTELVCVRVDEP